MYNWQKKKYIKHDKNEKEQQNKKEQLDNKDNNVNNEKEQQDNHEKEQQDSKEKEQQDRIDNNEELLSDNNEKEQQDNNDNKEKKQQDNNVNNENEQQDKNDNNEKEQLYNNEKEQQDNNENQQQVTQTDVENLDKINYFEIAVEVWNKMEVIQLLSNFSTLMNQVILTTKKIYLNTLNSSIIIIDVVCNALYELNLTNFDFYDEFINQHHYQQIDKQRNLGKQIQIDRFLHDIKKYSTKLAKVMSTKQMTQVQYIQQGFLYTEEKEEEKWQNEFFNNDDLQFGSYKKDLRSCSLVQQKEFYIAADLYSVLVVSKELNKQTFDWILEQLSIKNNCFKNCFEHLLIQMNQENLIKFDVQVFDRQQKVDAFKKSIESTLNLLRILNKHEFFKENYSS
ncbi:unnamed protein product (macronuclear) [Paramecium tetraurelia]|uniref:Uncharacterized protein n=1 Tax=Paramecium tetraurelia TaxID=5888 RepID=A0DEB0_PARTE|nr:uncharacterized protein GSPATT00016203001 [Paramecium tetraurelia]CAK81377.1 unnamed protein product [Paramecium tetraurelia]|eukprot:XP_001448774.1 hypothetical protein (macronuclear) [Paramecium tetraurelia strain d4-2]